MARKCPAERRKQLVTEPPPSCQWVSRWGRFGCRNLCSLDSQKLMDVELCWIPKNSSFGFWSNIRAYQLTFHSYITILWMPSKIPIEAPSNRMMSFQASRGTPRNSSGWISVCSSDIEDGRRTAGSITALDERISLWAHAICKHLNMQTHATYRHMMMIYIYIYVYTYMYVYIYI